MKIDGISTIQFNNQKTEQTQPREVTNTQSGGNQNDSVDVQTNNKNVKEEDVIRSIEHANKQIKLFDRKLEFSIHEKTKEIMVKVIDTKNDQVIREIPSEKILDMVVKLCEMAGLFVDEKR